MEIDEFKKTKKILYIYYFMPLLVNLLLLGEYYMLGMNEMTHSYTPNGFLYAVESVVLLFSLFAFWLALRMFSNRSMVVWLATHSESYVSIALIRMGLLHCIIVLGLVTHIIMGCPTTHWLCALGIIGLLFVWPSKGRILDESELIEQIRKDNENL